jgi:hypothetical protein
MIYFCSLFVSFLLTTLVLFLRIFGPILRDVLAWSAEESADLAKSDTKTGNSKQERRLSNPLQATAEALTALSLTPSQSADHLCHIFQSIGATPDFKELVHSLLGLGPPPDLWARQGVSYGSLASQMARAIMKFIEATHLLVVAVDDIHEVDEMSWRVLRIIFETAGNVLIICTARPLQLHTLNIEESFWNDLMTRYRLENRFVSMELKPLSRKEMQSMVEKTLRLSAAQVNQQLVDDVLNQSRGMPHIANEILESIQRQHESGAKVESLFKVRISISN